MFHNFTAGSRGDHPSNPVKNGSQELDYHPQSVSVQKCSYGTLHFETKRSQITQLEVKVHHLHLLLELKISLNNLHSCKP